MALDFPTNPALNEIYTYGGRSWQWNGTAWDVYNASGGLTQYVSKLNGLCGSINIAAGTSISVTPTGNTLTVSNTGVLNVNGSTGSVVTYAGTTGNIQFRYNNGVTANSYFTLESGPLGEITDIFTLSGTTNSLFYYGNQEAIGLQINRGYNSVGFDESGGVQIKVLGIGNDSGDIYSSNLRITTPVSTAAGSAIILDSGGNESFSVYQDFVYSKVMHYFNEGINSTNPVYTNTFEGPINAVGGTFSSQLNVQNLKMLTIGGNEGGQIDFGLATTNTSLTGGISIDVYQNQLRFFETGGTNRGAFIDLTTLPAGANTSLTRGVQSPIGMTSGSVRVITYPDGVTTSGSKTPYYQPSLLTYQVFNPSFTAYANRTYFTLHHTPRTVSIKNLRFTSANTVTTGNAYISVWSVDPDTGFPGTRLYVSASTTVGAGYNYTTVTNASGLVTVPSGPFYIAVTFSSTPTLYSISMNYTLSAYGSGNMTSGYIMTTPVVDTNGFTAPTSITAAGVTFSIIDYTPTYRTGVFTEFSIV